MLLDARIPGCAWQDGNDIDFFLNALGGPLNRYQYENQSYFGVSALLRLTLALPDILECDFDENNSCDVTDVGMLFAAMGTNDLAFDINGSGTIDSADVDIWLTSAGNENIGRPYLPGDVTLDGNVDPADLNVLGLNWQLDVSSWSHGDLRGDGRVDVLDLNKIGQHWLQTAAASNAATVPEPSVFVLGIIGLLALLPRAERASRTLRLSANRVGT